MRIDRKKLAILMIQKGVTSKSLSEKSGVSKSSICYIRNGKSCRDDIGQKIAAALAVDVTEILED